MANTEAPQEPEGQWLKRTDLSGRLGIPVATLNMWASGGKGPKRMAFTPNGAQVWVTNSASNQTTVFDAHAREMIAALEMAKAPSSLYFSGDGRRLFVTNANANELSTVDVASRKILTVVPIGTDPDGIIWSAR